jgi:cytoskeleton protein RodZ
MSSPGQELRKAREAKQISIEEMAASTKIVGRYLTAVEEDRLDLLPQGFFIKGILRTYAKALGLDEDEIILSYREAGILPEASSPEYAPAPREVRNVPGPNILRRRILAGAGILVVVVGLMFVWRACRPKPEAPKLPTASGSVSPVQPYSPPPEKLAPAETPPAGTEAAQEPAKPQAQAQPGQAAVTPPVQTDWKGLTLEITFQEYTWLRVYCDGVLQIDGNYPPGERITARAEREMLLHIGNAGGMTYYLNGRAGRTLGGKSEVIKDLRITPDNIADFLETKGGAGRTG